jgi:hypothetical protein
VWGSLALSLVVVATLLVLRLIWRGRAGAIVVSRDA